MASLFVPFLGTDLKRIYNGPETDLKRIWSEGIAKAQRRHSEGMAKAWQNGLGNR